jgi:hypothetical protein
MKIFVATLLLCWTVFSQDEDQIQPIKNKDVYLETPQKNISAETRASELKKKAAVRLENTHYEELNFLIKNHTEFIMIPDTEEEVSGTIDIFWKQNDVYLMANMQQN